MDIFWNYTMKIINFHDMKWIIGLYLFELKDQPGADAGGRPADLADGKWEGACSQGAPQSVITCDDVTKRHHL